MSEVKKIYTARYSDEYKNKINKLKNIYNIKTNSKLLEHLVDLELLKHNVK